MKLSEKKIVLGVGFTQDSEDKILEYLTATILKGKEKVKIVTPNPEMLLFARKDTHFKDVLNSAQVSLPDGMGVVMGSKILKRGIHTRITGVDFMEKLIKRVSDDLEKSAKRKASIGFIGGREKVAEKAAVCLQKKYQNTDFFVYPDDINAKSFTFQFKKFRKLVNGELVSVKIKRLDILFVAFGFPTQENWINANLPHISVTCAMGVGGAFDVISGKIKRAPKILQTAGLEWSWRLFLQPWRVKRQTKLIQYPYFIIAEKLGRK